LRYWLNKKGRGAQNFLAVESGVSQTLLSLILNPKATKRAGIDSQEAIIKAAGFKIENVSVQIVGNKPKIAPRRAEAIAAISKALSGAAVSVSATSTDGLGFTGEGKGLSAIATALLVSA
jgi:2-C-methyl-D-erythritol 2,4-cyclodiphosphate synthase